MAEKRRDIQNYEGRYHNAASRLKAHATKPNAELILKMDTSLGVSGVSFGRRSKVINCLTKIAGMMGKDMSKAGKDDIDNVVLKIRSCDYTDETKWDYLKILKQFFKFMDMDDLIKKLKVKNGRSHDRLPDNRMDDDTARKLIGEIKELGYRAFFTFVWETGARPTEAMSIRVKDIKISVHGTKEFALVSLIGKTGERKVPVAECLPLVKDLIKLKGPEDLLFDGSYSQYNRVLKDAATRMGIAVVEKDLVIYEKGKPVKRKVRTSDLSLYDFRRSRATFLSQKLTESQLCQYMGWVQGTNVIGRYVKLSGQALIPDIMSLSAETVACAFCGHHNNPSLKFCDACLKPLEADMIAKEKVRLEYDKIMEGFIKDKRFLALWDEHSAKRGEVNGRKG